MTKTNAPSTKRKGELKVIRCNTDDFSDEEMEYLISQFDQDSQYSDAEREYLYSVMFND